MGNRNRGSLPTLPMNGALSQVAVYDYPLTITDITNHLSQIWAPAAFTQHPTGGTFPESFTGDGYFDGQGRWHSELLCLGQRRSGACSAVTNFDGTAHYPVISTVAGDQQGPFSPKLVINQLKPSDSGHYWLRVYNPLNTNNVPPGQTNSAVATVTITPDTTIPVVTDIGPRGTTVSGPVIDDLIINFGDLRGPQPDARTPVPGGGQILQAHGPDHGYKSGQLLHLGRREHHQCGDRRQRGRYEIWRGLQDRGPGYLRPDSRRELHCHS